jgi:DNA-binding CsgD family transcriptional regulator
MADDLLRLVLDDAGQPPLDDRAPLLAKMAEQLGLQNASYLAINLPRTTHREYYVQYTFRGGWAEHYDRQGYVDIDPLVRRGLTGLMPIDWNTLPELTPLQRQMFGESREFKVGLQGITFPLLGPNGERAVLSFTADLSKRDWADYRQEKLFDMRLMASLFHRSVMNELSHKKVEAGVRLTERERECLLWCAEGKTHGEIASILGISPRTVRFFLDNARRKLNCLNTVQTVVCAMQRGLL